MLRLLASVVSRRGAESSEGCGVGERILGKVEVCVAGRGPGEVQLWRGEVGERLHHGGQARQEPPIVVKEPQKAFEGGLICGRREGGELRGVSGERADARLQDVVSEEVDGGAEEH